MSFKTSEKIISIFWTPLTIFRAFLGSKLRALDGVSTHPTATDSTGVLAGVLEDIESQAREQKLRLLHVNTKTFALHASLPGLEFGYAFLKGVK